MMSQRGVNAKRSRNISTLQGHDILEFRSATTCKVSKKHFSSIDPIPKITSPAVRRRPWKSKVTGTGGGRSLRRALREESALDARALSCADGERCSPSSHSPVQRCYSWYWRRRVLVSMEGHANGLCQN